MAPLSRPTATQSAGIVYVIAVASALIRAAISTAVNRMRIPSNVGVRATRFPLIFL